MNEKAPYDRSDSPEKSPSSEYEQIIAASPDVVSEAISAEVKRLTELATSGREMAPIERESVMLQLRTIGNVGGFAREWTRRNAQLEAYGKSPQTFMEFMEEKVDDAFEMDEDADTMDKIVDASNWIGGERYNSVVGEIVRDRQEMDSLEREVDTNADFTTSHERPSDPFAQQEAAEDARHSIETIYGNELFKDIVKLGKNRTQLRADIEGGYKSIGDGPKDGRATEYIPGKIRDKERRSGDWKQDLSEGVSFTKLIEYDTREVLTESVQKGRFGKKQVTQFVHREKVPDSEHQKVVNNELTGQDEPAVRFRYLFQYSQSALQSTHNGELPRYPGYNDGRDGQNVAVSLDLPQSVAEQLQVQIEQNPASARQLAEELFLNNNNGLITEADWSQGSARVGNRVKPPYEGLPSDWKIAVITGEEDASSTGADTDFARYDIRRVSAV